MFESHVLVIDGYNLLHRARSGFIAGEYSIVFNFFRALRCEIEKHKATRVIMVVEGTPKRQLNLDPEYKANRRIEPGTEKETKYISFLRQKEIIMGLLKHNFPVNIMKHDDFEADDTIYNVVKNSTRAIPITVISTDTDFIQLLEKFDNVKLYNPVKKTYQMWPGYPYVCWKALRGDPSDNIPAVLGVRGDKSAEKIVKEEKILNDFLKEDPDRLAQWKKNFEMIEFKDFNRDETMAIETIVGVKSWDKVKEAFDLFGFKSITNEKSWNKFTSTFEHLF